MQKRVTIITIVLVAVIFIATSVGLYLLASTTYNKKASTITAETDAAKKELSALKASKDKNGFTPTEVTKAFFTEVKSDSLDKAKLYLAPEAQAMDIAATLKLGSDIANISTGENMEEADGDNVNVSMTFVLPTDETVLRVFSLSKYDNAWKITGVTAL